MKTCMGGYACTKREQCPHYNASSSESEPAERLCIRGRDGIRLIEASAGAVVLVDVFDGREVERIAA